MKSLLRCFTPKFLILFAVGPCLSALLLGICIGYPALANAQQSSLRVFPTAESGRVEVITDTLKVTLDTEGGSVIRSEFIKTSALVGLPSNLVLFDSSRDRVYLAQSGLIGGGFPTHRTVMTFEGDRYLKEGATELMVKFESPVMSGVKLRKTYIFRRGSYVVDVKHEVLNLSAFPIALMLYLQLVRDGNKEAADQLSTYATFTGPSIFTAAKQYQRVEFHEIENNRAVAEKYSPYGYVAMVQHFFATAWLLGDGVIRENFVRKVDTNLYAVGMITKLKDIAPSATATSEARLFIGPRIVSVTQPLRLEAIQDDGWLLNFLQKLKH